MHLTILHTHAGGLQHLVDAGLTSLRILELANNRISRVEELESLKGLTSLQSLDVDACPLATKPDFDPKKVFTMLKELKYLNGADEEGRGESRLLVVRCASASSRLVVLPNAFSSLEYCSSDRWP